MVQPPGPPKLELKLEPSTPGLLPQPPPCLTTTGDDTQRQMGAMPYVRPAKVFRIFLTSLHPNSLLGLPGLLCTIGLSRAKGHETADIPIHVYGPPGTAEYLSSVFMVCVCV